MATAVVEEFPFLKDEEGQGFVSVIASKIVIILWQNWCILQYM